MTHATTRGTSEFPDDFLDCIRALNAHHVEYLLVGGYAVGMYGHVRATADIDFFYNRTPENVGRLMAALHDFGAPASLIDATHFAGPDSVTKLGLPPTRIDLLADITGVSFVEARVGAVHVEIEGEILPVIGLDALRTNKQATRRRKDLDDLKHLPLTPDVP